MTFCGNVQFIPASTLQHLVLLFAPEKDGAGSHQNCSALLVAPPPFHCGTLPLDAHLVQFLLSIPHLLVNTELF